PMAGVTGLRIETIGPTRSSKRTRKPAPNKKKRNRAAQNRTVELKPAEPVVGLLYAPVDNVNEFDGEPRHRMSCGREADAGPLRWEKLAFGADGNARLEVDDLWFDSRACSVLPASASVITLKPIAWDNGKPWLFAVRGENSVTF